MNTNIRNQIIKELRFMGFNIKHIGTGYMAEAIEMIYKSKDSDILKSVEKNVYSKIAKNHNKNASTIKSNIVKATNCMYEQYILEKKYKKDIYYRVYDKLTPKDVINSVLLKIGA